MSEQTTQEWFEELMVERARVEEQHKDDPDFYGHEHRECGEHRTVGWYRAWCFDCSEWCYPNAPCARCELPQLREAIVVLTETISVLNAQLYPKT